MGNKRVVAVLRNGARVESEPLSDDAARAEATRLFEQLDAGRTNKFVRVRATAIVNLEDLDRVIVEDVQAEA